MFILVVKIDESTWNLKKKLQRESCGGVVWRKWLMYSRHILQLSYITVDHITAGFSSWGTYASSQLRRPGPSTKAMSSVWPCSLGQELEETWGWCTQNRGMRHPTVSLWWLPPLHLLVLWSDSPSTSCTPDPGGGYILTQWKERRDSAGVWQWWEWATSGLPPRKRAGKESPWWGGQGAV